MCFFQCCICMYGSENFTISVSVYVCVSMHVKQHFDPTIYVLWHCLNQFNMVGMILCDLWSWVMKGNAVSNLFSEILTLGTLNHHVTSEYFEAAKLWVSLSPMARPCIGAEVNNESNEPSDDSSSGGFPLAFMCSQLRPQTCRSRVMLFILCPVWITDGRICEFNKMVVLNYTAIWGNLLHSNSNQNRKLEPNLSQTSDKELKSAIFSMTQEPNATLLLKVNIMLFPNVPPTQTAWRRSSASYYRDAQGGSRNRNSS